MKHSPKQWLMLAGGSMAACSQPAEEKQSTPKEHEKPNILLIVADDLGWKDLGCYGSSFYETPKLDAFADQGIRFSDAYAACPVSSPSRASLQTGLYTPATGVTDYIPGRSVRTGPTPHDRLLVQPTATELAHSYQTLAEVLKANGYATFFAGKWHLGEDGQFWPEHQGYDINKGGFSAGYLRPVKDKCGSFFSPYCNPRLEDGPDGEYLPERLTNETISFIEQNEDGPFYACLSFYLVHTPLMAHDTLVEKYREKRAALNLSPDEEMDTEAPWIAEASVGRGYRDRLIQAHPTYAAMVESLDWQIGRLIDYLKEKGLYENTIILFTSDNGGLSSAEGSPTSNLPLRAGKGWIYEGGIRVPMIMSYPGMKTKGVSEIPVSGIDVMPTLLALAGIKDETCPKMDGINIIPYIEEKTQPERKLFWYYPHYPNQGAGPAAAVREGNFKLVLDFERDDYYLYDLESDIGESKDLKQQMPEKAEELYASLMDWVKSYGPLPFSPNPDYIFD